MRMRTGKMWTWLAVCAVILAMAAACGGRDASLPPTPLPPDEAAAETQAQAVERLRANADAFDYSVGDYGGTLNYATISTPLTFNLALANDSYSSEYLGYVFEGLTETSWLDDSIEPRLAESWERSDDGLVWTFALRRDVTWHDGAPFTAHDVDFTFNRIIYNDAIPTNDRELFTFDVTDPQTGEQVDRRMTVTAVDDHTVRIELPVSYAPFLRAMGNAIYPRHILEPYVEAGTFGEVWDVDTDPAEVIGTGPFTIVSYIPGDRMTLQRNPNYWLRDGDDNRLPYLDGIVYRFVEEFDDELALFRAGDVDVHGVLGEEFAELESQQEAENFAIHRRGPGFGTTFLTFNVNSGAGEDGAPFVRPEARAWFETQAFRQAAAHSVDKDAIVEHTLDGVGYPQWSSITPAAGEFHNPNIPRYAYDLAAANALLDGLGWVDTDGDGVREDGDGNRIAFTITTNDGNTVRQRATHIIASGLRDIGLDVVVKVIDFGILVDQLTTTYDWEGIVIGFSGGSDPYGGIALWHSGADLHLWHPNQPEPTTAWEAEIDDLYTRASQSLDRDERVRLYHRAQVVAAEQAPVIYTSLAERMTAVRNVFANLTPTLYGLWDTRYLYRTDG